MRPTRIGQRHLLRGRDDNRPVQRRLLDQGQLHVAGAGRQVHHQHVQRRFLRPPTRLGQHLGDGLRRHRPAPDHGVVSLGQQPHRHGLQSMGDMGNNGPVHIGRLARQPQHGRQRRSIDVGVQNPDRQAPPRQGRRQIDRHGRLADPALAAGHRQNTLHMGRTLGRNRRLGPSLIGRSLRQARRATGSRSRHGLGGQHDRDPRHARHGLQRRLGCVAHGGVDRRLACRNLHDEARAILGHRQPLNQTGGDQPLSRFRVHNGVEGGDYSGAVDQGSAPWPLPGRSRAFYRPLVLFASLFL